MAFAVGADDGQEARGGIRRQRRCSDVEVES